MDEIDKDTMMSLAQFEELLRKKNHKKKIRMVSQTN